jgi:hypothetical protein
MTLMEMDSLIRARRAIADDATDPHQVARTSQRGIDETRSK